MTRLLILIPALLLSQILFGQKKVSSDPRRLFATEKETKQLERSKDCIKHTSKTFTTRLKNYPFNMATQIQLVSFKSNADTSSGWYYKDSLPRKNDTVCYSKLYELKNLSFSQVDKLTDLLYNYGYRMRLKDDGLIYVTTSPQCYNPRNAILFLDSTGKVFEFIEICFQCQKTKESSGKINLGVMCNQKLDLLKNFFVRTGIKYGTAGRFTDQD